VAQDPFERHGVEAALVGGVEQARAVELQRLGRARLALGDAGRRGVGRERAVLRAAVVISTRPSNGSSARDAAERISDAVSDGAGRTDAFRVALRRRERNMEPTPVEGKQ
jgi:hypothetical protein